MTQTPPELLAPYKAPLVAAARDLLRAAGTDGIAFEIPASVPPCTIVVGATDGIGQLLRTPSREPMLGGRRAGDPPASPLTWDEPDTGPRSWTLLLAADGTGVAGKQGSTFAPAAESLERVDVIEAEPVLRQITELQRENAELRDRKTLPTEQIADLATRCGVKGSAAALAEFVALARDAQPLAAEEMRPVAVVAVEEQGQQAVAESVAREPFMYAIASPDGRPRFDEHCVDSNAEALKDVAQFASDYEGVKYSVVPVYLAAPVSAAPAAPTADLSRLSRQMWDLQEFYRDSPKAIEAIEECRALLAAPTAAEGPSARDAVLEEAAKVADSEAAMVTGGFAPKAREAMAVLIATRIRAKKAAPSAELRKALRDLVIDVESGVLDGDALRDAQAILDRDDDADADADADDDATKEGAGEQDAKDEGPVISSYDIEKVKVLKFQFVESLIHGGVQHRTCGAISAALNRIIDESAAIAAQPKDTTDGQPLCAR